MELADLPEVADFSDFTRLTYFAELIKLMEKDRTHG